MEPSNTQAIVIGIKDYGEADKIVTFYSKDRGRMAGIAKGAKRSLKRFVNRLELFTLLEIHFTDSRSSSLVRLDQAEPLAHFPVLRSDYQRYAAGVLLCELMLQWTRENDPDPQLFDLLCWGLANLEDLSRPTLWGVILFQTKMLTLLGYQPELAACGNCDAPVKGGRRHRFRPGRGTLLCSDCDRLRGAEEREGADISVSTALLLKKGQELETEKLSRLRFSPRETAEAVSFLRTYTNHILQREILAWDQLLHLERSHPSSPRQRPAT